MKSGNIEVSDLTFVDGTVQISAVLSNLLVVKNIIGDYIILADDLNNNSMIRIFEPFGSTAHVFLPSDNSVLCPIGTSITISASGFGNVSIEALAPAIVISPSIPIIDRKYGRMTAIKTKPDTWKVNNQY